jgi:mannose-1-phosphate guanylyltransferase
LKNTKIQAVILAGGMGTRLRPYTFLLPKPMLPVGPKPILEHILDWLKQNEVTDVVVSVGYLGKMIKDYFKSGREWGMKIEYVTSPPLGTAGQLKAAEGKIRGRFVCLYGDALLEMNLREVVDFHIMHDALATMTLMKYSTELKYGFMETDKEGLLTRWREKPTVSGNINIGCFIMEKAFLDYIPSRKMFGMDQAFGKAMESGAKVYGIRVDGRFTDIGDRKAYREANDEYLQKMGKVL